MYIGYYQNEYVKIKIIANKDSILDISFVKCCPKEFKENENFIIKQCKEQLEEYFSRKRKDFTFKYQISGTQFQEKVWKALLNVKYGTTISYKKLAENIGSPKAVRAVANAVGKNKIGIAIPCHRIIGSDGTLTGYAGGLENKKYLLELEMENKERLEN